MEILTKQTNYQKHLYFENLPNSKEYALNKCIGVLGIIAKLKDRNRAIAETCEQYYGRDENGKIKATDKEAGKFNRNLAAIARLKNYYNTCIEKLKKF